MFVAVIDVMDIEAARRQCPACRIIPTGVTVGGGNCEVRIYADDRAMLDACLISLGYDLDVEVTNTEFADAMRSDTAKYESLLSFAENGDATITWKSAWNDCKPSMEVWLEELAELIGVDAELLFPTDDEHCAIAIPQEMLHVEPVNVVRTQPTRKWHAHFNTETDFWEVSCEGAFQFKLTGTFSWVNEIMRNLNANN